MTFEASVQWLEREARRTIRASQRGMTSGIHAFPPQVGTGYEAFWLRDYAYMLESCADAFSRDELLSACRLFVNAIRPGDAAAVDCVKFNGEPVFKPGYGTMGSKPVLDGAPFTVNVVWLTWRQTGDRRVAAESVEALVRTMSAMPLNPETGLTHISTAPGEDRCPYGFTDTVAKRGDQLFDSLLFIQAARRLGGMLAALARPEAARRWEDAAARASEAINRVLWDEATGLYLAATEQCRQPDIWGSAFAVWLGVACGARARRIATVFRDTYDGICQHGQIRHLPRGIYWERACQPDTYQNGGYWATPTGWFVHALALADAARARQTVVALVHDFARRGICEWVLNETARLPGYVASATLPLQGIRMVR